MFVDDRVMRVRVRRVIKRACGVQGRDLAAFRRSVPLKIKNGSAHTIVLGIISDKWKDGRGGLRSLNQVVPFLSRVGLRRVVADLARRAYAVRVARIVET